MKDYHGDYVTLLTSSLPIELPSSANERLPLRHVTMDAAAQSVWPIIKKTIWDGIHDDWSECQSRQVLRNQVNVGWSGLRCRLCSWASYINLPLWVDSSSGSAHSFTKIHSRVRFFKNGLCDTCVGSNQAKRRHALASGLSHAVWGRDKGQPVNHQTTIWDSLIHTLFSGILYIQFSVMFLK